MNLHPKIAAALSVSTIYSILVAVLAGLDALPDSDTAKIVGAIVGALLPVLAGYATPGGPKGVAVDQAAPPPGA
jgi:uncharacterized sodium:solute symporter family permease YidK